MQFDVQGKWAPLHHRAHVRLPCHAVLLMCRLPCEQLQAEGRGWRALERLK